MTDICAVVVGFALEIAAAPGDDAAQPVAAGSKNGAAKTIRKNLGRRAGAMAEPAMLSPKVPSVPPLSSPSKFEQSGSVEKSDGQIQRNSWRNNPAASFSVIVFLRTIKLMNSLRTCRRFAIES